MKSYGCERVRDTPCDVVSPGQPREDKLENNLDRREEK